MFGSGFCEITLTSMFDAALKFKLSCGRCGVNNVEEKINHAATLVVIREKEDGILEMIAFIYLKHTQGRPPFSSWKFPAETQESGETRWMTAANGMVRELSSTPDSPEGFVFHSLGPSVNSEAQPFLVCRVPGDPGKGAKWHDKCVFLIELHEDSVGHLRKIVKPDGPDELLDPPEFIEAGELWKRMMERGQPFHRAVLFKTIEHYASDPKVYRRYGSILEDRRNQEAITSRGKKFEFI